MILKNGFGYVWEQQFVMNENVFISAFHRRINDIFIQQCNENISNVSSHRLYQNLSADNPQYLREVNEKYIRMAISKFRLGSHNFLIERGRWQCPKLEYLSRICSECKDIEDEFHVVLKCFRYLNLRKQYLPKHLYEKPSMYKFIQFLNTANGTTLKRFGLFCHKVLIEYRNNFI